MVCSEVERKNREWMVEKIGKHMRRQLRKSLWSGWKSESVGEGCMERI